MTLSQEQSVATIPIVAGYIYVGHAPMMPYISPGSKLLYNCSYSYIVTSRVHNIREYYELLVTWCAVNQQSRQLAM